MWHFEHVIGGYLTYISFRHVLAFLHRELPEIYMGSIELDNGETEDFVVTRTSTFGEAEVDVAMW